MTNSQEFSDRDFNEAWKSIEEDLSDITPPSTSFPDPSPTDFSPSPQDSPAEDPRNWSGPDEEAIEELLAEEDDISYKEVSEKDLLVERPHVVFAWMAAIVFILLGLGISTSFLPGSASFGIVLLVAGFGLAALAAYWTARRAWEDNPFDDGSRV
ncbi:MAG: hypothetical protein IKS49_06100 [Actinomycetaceae bacterium]|nr:hypothetical protein [Actinomycetaceae bacterium]